MALDRAIKQLWCSSDMHTHNIGLRIENNRGSVCLAKSGGSPRDLRQVCGLVFCFFLPLVVEIGRQVNSRATTQPLKRCGCGLHVRHRITCCTSYLAARILVGLAGEQTERQSGRASRQGARAVRLRAPTTPLASPATLTFSSCLDGNLSVFFRRFYARAPPLV